MAINMIKASSHRTGKALASFRKRHWAHAHSLSDHSFSGHEQIQCWSLGRVYGTYKLWATFKALLTSFLIFEPHLMEKKKSLLRCHQVVTSGWHQYSSYYSYSYFSVEPQKHFSDFLKLNRHNVFLLGTSQSSFLWRRSRAAQLTAK